MAARHARRLKPPSSGGRQHAVALLNALARAPRSEADPVLRFGNASDRQVGAKPGTPHTRTTSTKANSSCSGRLVRVLQDAPIEDVDGSP